MTVVINNGQEYQADAEFASHSLYKAYMSSESWDSENYLLVEIGSVFPAWITKSENETLSMLTGLGEIDQFATDLNILAIPRDKFTKWRLGS
jgi:hypothetical protein